MVALPASSDNPGSVQAREEYFPYGKASDRRDERNRYRYIGVERDEATGQYVAGPRTYDAETGRFLQGEPIISESILQSPYSYAGLSPVAYLDSSGRKRERATPEVSSEPIEFDPLGTPITPSGTSPQQGFTMKRAEGMEAIQSRLETDKHGGTDWAGLLILNQYMLGEGKDVVIHNSERWTDYLTTAPVSPKVNKAGDIFYWKLQTVTEQALKDVTEYLVENHQDSVGETLYVKFAIPRAKIAQRGRGTGFYLLNQPDDTIGGFFAVGTAVISETETGFSVEYDLTFVWQDLINDNPKYRFDKWWAPITRAFGAKNYGLRISWDAQQTVSVSYSSEAQIATEVSGGWPASDE
ncbi:MAG: RHS repeat-associated core domain-containing protein [Myxococcota bacterium]|nr:RHS repeat-associated core domain-containing protein [Myxococcota bacterium]